MQYKRKLASDACKKEKKKTTIENHEEGYLSLSSVAQHPP